MTSFRRIILAGLVAMPLSAAQAMDNPQIPEHLRGKWAPTGKCASAEAKIEISLEELTWSNGTRMAILHGMPDASGWRGSIYFREEGIVSFFAYDETPGVLVFFPEGFNMPPRERWERCT